MNASDSCKIRLLNHFDEYGEFFEKKRKKLTNQWRATGLKLRPLQNNFHGQQTYF